jgi:hypothetical protein
MMEEHDLPVRVRLRELLIDPAQLGRVEIHGIEGEELNAIARDWRKHPRGSFECVVPMAAHIEQRIFPLRAHVVIAPCRMEFHAAVEQRFKWLFESHAVGLGGSVAVIVVPEHEHEVERKAFALRDQLRRGFALRGAPLAGIADNREFE